MDSLGEIDDFLIELESCISYSQLPDCPRPRRLNQQQTRDNIEEVGSRSGQHNSIYSLNIQLKVRGYTRGQILQSFPVCTISGMSLDEIQTAILEIAKSHIRGTFTKPEGIPILEPIRETSLPAFKDFIKLRRRIGLISLDEYSKRELI